MSIKRIKIKLQTSVVFAAKVNNVKDVFQFTHKYTNYCLDTFSISDKNTFSKTMFILKNMLLFVFSAVEKKSANFHQGDV